MTHARAPNQSLRSRKPVVVDRTPDRAPINWKLAVRRYIDDEWTIAEIARHAEYSLAQVRRGLLERRVKLRPRRARTDATRLLNGLWRAFIKRSAVLALPERRPILYQPWSDFDSFRIYAAAHGYRPGLAFVRIDPLRGFVPDNVRFVRPDEIAHVAPWTGRRKAVRSIVAFGEAKSLGEWVQDPRCVVTRSGLWNRLRGGMRPKEALTTPAAPGRRDVIPHTIVRPYPPRFRIDVERARRLYARGMNFTEIARELGANRVGIRDALARAGVKKRPRSTLWVTRSGVLLGKIWHRIRSMCTNPKDRSYARVGARGVRVCREWDTFKPFHDWALSAGWKPGLSLIQCEPSRGYNPQNCRFVTTREASLQATAPSRTRAPYVLVTAFGQTKGMTAWGRDRRCVVSETTFAKRLRQGTLPEEALSMPSRSGFGPHRGSRFVSAFGETKSLARWLKDPRCKVTAFGLRYRLRQGMAPEVALSTPPWRTSLRRWQKASPTPSMSRLRDSTRRT